MKKNKKIAFALGTVVMLGCGALQAADKACTRPDIANAQKTIDRIVSWSQLRKAWGDYKQCDSGDVADQFTDALLRLVVEWKNVDELASAMDKDPDYKSFVMTHLKSPAAKDDQPTVYSRAKKDCPRALDTFCADLAEAVKAGPATAAASKGGIEFQPLLEPLKVQGAKPEAAKPDAK
jgi:hypothetical protein